MPIPSFSDTLDGTLGLGITIIHDGDIFPSDDDSFLGLDMKKMNAELKATTKVDDIEFMPAEPPKEDISFKQFLLSKQNAKQNGHTA